MKVVYGNDQVTFDASSILGRADVIYIPATTENRSTTFGLPCVVDSTVCIEDDFGKKVEFVEGQHIFIERIGKTYHLRDVADLAPVSKGGEELPLQIMANKFICEGQRVIEVSNNEDGALCHVIARLIGDDRLMVSMRSDTGSAAVTAASVSNMGNNIAVEGAILSSVPLVKNVYMLKEAEPGFDDIDTWSHAETITHDDLKANHIDELTQPADVLILGCNHDKYRRLTVDFPQMFEDAQCVFVKNDFRVTYEAHKFQDDLTDMGFVNVMNIGADAPIAHIGYMANMYQVWKKNP
jgi:hypothetical protein